jgi:hypothetical protein
MESAVAEAEADDWVLGTGYWVLGTGYWVLGTGYWVLGTGYWALGSGSSGTSSRGAKCMWSVVAEGGILDVTYLVCGSGRAGIRPYWDPTDWPPQTSPRGTESWRMRWTRWGCARWKGQESYSHSCSHSYNHHRFSHSYSYSYSYRNRLTRGWAPGTTNKTERRTRSPQDCKTARPHDNGQWTKWTVWACPNVRALTCRAKLLSSLFPRGRNHAVD